MKRKRDRKKEQIQIIGNKKGRKKGIKKLRMTKKEGRNLKRKKGRDENTIFMKGPRERIPFVTLII